MHRQIGVALAGARRFWPGQAEESGKRKGGKPEDLPPIAENRLLLCGHLKGDGGNYIAVKTNGCLVVAG